MDEDSLKKIHINELFDMLVERTNKLIILDNQEDETQFEAKKKEIELLQRIIVARRTEFRPGYNVG
jgi:hypothetical protein